MDSTSKVHKSIKNGKHKRQEQKNLNTAVNQPELKSALVKSRDFAKDLSEYLSMWKVRDQGGNWKFNKVLQAWALENCMEKDVIDSKLFKELIPYILTVKGSALDRLAQKALDVINQKITSEDNGGHESVGRPNLKRALKIHQCISEI